MLLELKNIKKVYGKTIALKDLSLTAMSGQILGIVGPNGAGKSTMIKILSGEEASYEGNILLNGAPWKDSGIQVGIVHQETKLFPNLTVAENLLIGREGKTIKRPKVSSKDIEMMEKLRINQFANRLLSDCPLLVKQLCEICRALIVDAGVFLFDEPNSALTEKESVELFQQIHRLKLEDKIIFIVTHRLKEIVLNADKVVVIKDGENAFEFEKDLINEDRLARSLVVGEQRSYAVKESNISTKNDEAKEESQTLLRIKNLTHFHNIFKNVNIDVRQGEVLALMGVEGSGAREILRSICGFIPSTGSFELNNCNGSWSHNIDAAFLPASRHESLFHHLSIKDNILMRLGYPDITSRIGRLYSKVMNSIASKLRVKYNILTSNLNNPVDSLSGGNQQKVAVANVLAKKPKILVLEEPTRGVDVQSKAEIYSYIKEYLIAGNAALVFCTEVMEAYELANRIIVVNNGKLSPYLDVGSFKGEAELAANIARLEMSLESASV